MTTELKNDRLLRALAREPVDATPVWIMRQAGRYLPEYRELRQQAGSFMGLATNPELACRVTLQPLNRFDLDAAILFSDILTIPDAMGLGLYFVPGEGPRFERTIANAADIERLPAPDPETELRYVMDAVRLIRRELNGKVPLIGFAGSPWTLTTYMVEGGSSKNFARAKGLLYNEPAAAHALLGKLAAAVTAYLNAQIKAGAQVVMLFDSWGGVLTPAHYREFSLAYLARIVDGLIPEHEGRQVPAILFTKGGCAYLEALADTGAAALGLDWNCNLGNARRRVNNQVALQGNLDPGALAASASVIRDQVSQVLADYGKGPGHVFNLGHGITPDVDPENVTLLVEAVHELSREYHEGS